jgi:hypothetical protein
VIEEVQVAAARARRLDCLVMPLEQTLRLREGPVLLRVRRSRHEEDLGGDIFGAHLAGGDLRSVPPECRRLDEREVLDDHPFQTGHGEPLHLAVR